MAGVEKAEGNMAGVEKAVAEAVKQPPPYRLPTRFPGSSSTSIFRLRLSRPFPREHRVPSCGIAHGQVNQSSLTVGGTDTNSHDPSVPACA